MKTPIRFNNDSNYLSTSTGSIHIFSENSFLSRNGNKSSNGFEIIVPSGFFKEETLGING
jgi:hypothetical protein